MKTLFYCLFLFISCSVIGQNYFITTGFGTSWFHSNTTDKFKNAPSFNIGLGVESHKEGFGYMGKVSWYAFNAKINALDRYIHYRVARFSFAPRFEFFGKTYLYTGASIGLNTNRETYIARPTYIFDYDFVDWSAFVIIQKNIFHFKTSSINIGIEYSIGINGIIDHSFYQRDKLSVSESNVFVKYAFE